MDPFQILCYEPQVCIVAVDGKLCRWGLEPTAIPRAAADDEKWVLVCDATKAYCFNGNLIMI